jgi:hypothetical protein
MNLPFVWDEHVKGMLLTPPKDEPAYTAATILEAMGAVTGNEQRKTLISINVKLNKENDDLVDVQFPESTIGGRFVKGDGDGDQSKILLNVYFQNPNLLLGREVLVR